jgi:N-acetylmuramoyl-L-alanine amidase/Putative peptidoglycan binding domain
MAHSLTWLARVLNDAGLKVAEVPGWPNRGVGNVGDIKGVICHHTAGGRNGNMPSLKVITDGRSDLQGPLSQLGLGRDGTFYVIAAGRANHAGRGEWKGVTTGNSSFIGIEAENVGQPAGKPDHEPWPDVQMDAYQRGVAAILKHLGLKALMACSHKEYALPKGRKPDPQGIDMNEFRSRVSALMAGTASPPARPPIPPKDDVDRPTMRRGNPGNPKFLVQALQRTLGFAPEKCDGSFGPMTEARVRDFQRQRGLVPDGIVGPRTWTALDSV